MKKESSPQLENINPNNSHVINKDLKINHKYEKKINNFTEIIEDGKTNSFTKELKITTSCFEETQDIFQGDTLGEAIAFASHPKYFNKTKCERIKLAILETIEILQKILTQTFEKEEVNDVNSRIRILNIMKDGIFENPRIIEEYLNADFTKEWRKALANIANKKKVSSPHF